MRILRFSAYLLTLFLLCLAAAGVYLYPRLPALAVQQAENLLADYGVQAIEFEGPVVNTQELRLQTLKLRGELDGLAFNATLKDLQLGYSWQLLLEGRFRDLQLNAVELVLEQRPDVSEPASTAITVDEVLPHSAIQQLPLKSIDIRHLVVQYPIPEQEPVTVTGELHLAEQQLSLHLSSLYLGIEIDGHLQTGDDAHPLSVKLNMAQNGSSIVKLAAQLQRESTQQWLWSIAGELEWGALLNWLQGAGKSATAALNTTAIEALTMQGSSTLQAVLKHPNTLHTAASDELQPMQQLIGNILLESNLSDVDYPPFIDSIKGDLHTALSLEDNQWSATFQTPGLTGALDAGQLALTTESLHWLGWPQLIPISLSGSGKLHTSSAAIDHWSVQLSDSQLYLGNAKSHLRINELQLKATGDLAPQGTVDAIVSAGLQSRIRKAQLPSIKLDFSHRGPLEQGDLKLQLEDTAESMRLLIAGTGNLNTGSGRYALKAYSMDLPYASSTLVPLLQKFDVLEQDLELNSGTFKLDSVITSGGFDPAGWRMQSHLVAETLSGTMDEYRFNDASLNANWRGVEQWQTLEPIELAVGSLDVGFPIIDIQATATLPRPTTPAQPTVRIENFSAGLFGGRVYLPQAHTWDFSAPSNSLTLKAENWQLAELVAMQQDQQIDAQGELEGELPITLRDGRIIIDKGYLKATASGGNIRYSPNAATQALADSSPELGMAMDLLRDFRYQVLSSEVELDQAGNLLLGLSLGGRNPNQYDGRQVNFNINLEQNLDPLLQSLRLSDTLVEKIENRLQ